VSSDVETFDELQSLLSNMNQQGQGDGTRTCINEVMDKICDLFKCTAKRVFPTKNRNSPCNKSDKPWFNKLCLEKRKKFHTTNNRYNFAKNRYRFAKNRYSFVKNRYSFVKRKENLDEMKKKHVKNLSRK
jgi:hypothetical protein